MLSRKGIVLFRGFFIKFGEVFCMNIELYKEFICLAKYLNFSEAAYALHISQPTLSRHIAQLEYELKTALFIRNQSTRQLSLTTAGEILLPDALTIISYYEASIKKIEAHISGFNKELIIGYRRLYGCPKWNQVLQLFREQNPDVNMDFFSDNSFDSIYANLHNDVTDIAIVIGIEEFSKHEFKSIPFDKTSLCAVMSTKHPLAGKRSVSFADLANAKLALPSPENHLSFSNLLTDEFEKHNVSISNPIYCKNIEDAELYVSMNQAINIIPKCYYTKSDSSICAKDIRGTIDNIDIFCYYKNESSHHSAIHQFVKIIKSLND